MTAEIIIAITGAVTGIGGLIFGIVKWRASKKKDSIQSIIQKELEPLKRTNEEQNRRIAKLEQKQDENERDRLRAEVMIMVNKLRNGMLVTTADFKHIHRVYDKYKALNGNSYIDDEMIYIIEKEHEYYDTLEQGE